MDSLSKSLFQIPFAASSCQTGSRRCTLANHSRALERHGNNGIAVAILCDEFLKSNFFSKLKTAMERRDYATAGSVAAILAQKAQDFALPLFASYLDNFQKNLERQNYDYANMYLHDMEVCYNKTIEVMSGMLKE